MMTESILFWVFSSVLVMAAFFVITARNPVHAALFLILAFFQSACIWMLLQAEFLAIALVLVYVGAVMVLFLFVVMMLDLNVDEIRRGFWRHAPLAGVIVVVVVVELAVGFASSFGQIEAEGVMVKVSNTHDLGMLLFTEYLLALEVAGALLLVAIIAAISLSLRRREGVKRIDPSEQVKAKPQDRLRVMKVEPVKEQDVAADA